MREDRAFLLVKASYRRSWSLPGGFMGPSEEPVAAATRELYEETGLRVLDAKLLGADPRRFHTDHLVVGRVRDLNADRASTAWEIGALRWLRAPDVEQQRSEIHPHTLRLLRLLPGGLVGFLDQFTGE